VKRGEVWEVNLEPVLGAEIRKVRPCIIVSRNALSRLPLKIVVPVTGWSGRYAEAPWHVRIDPSAANGLKKDSSADTFQVRSISDLRLVRRLGAVSDAVMHRIDASLLVSLSLDR
jgi:mRNA interferase MazF